MDGLYRSALRFRIRMRFPQSYIDHSVILRGDASNLHLDGCVVLQTGVLLHAGGLDWCNTQGCIEIGDGSVISPYCVIYGCGEGGVRIGRDFDCGPGVGIYASRTDYEHGPNHHVFAPVTIGDAVVVYANAVISPGVTIGDGAVIAANSVVTQNVPPRTLFGGAPARLIRHLGTETH